MRPLRLKMENFLSYEDEEFDFSQITNATITGRNGAGKSSFCTDAITWSLFGKGSRGSEKESGNYISIGATSCTVELTFALNDATYKVIRSVRANKGNRMALNLFAIDKNGAEIPLTGANLSSTQRKIEDLLKMNYKTFTASSMIFQGKSDEFTNEMSSAERKEALINILNINEWEDVQLRAKEDLAELTRKQSAQQTQLDTQNEIIAHKKEYAARREGAKKELKEVVEQKERQSAIIEKNQKAIFQRHLLQQGMEQKQAEKVDVQNRMTRENNDIRAQQYIIERSTQSIKKNNDEINRQKELLGRQKEIEAAVEKEKALTKEVNALWERQQKYSSAKEKLEQIANNGKLWKANWEKDIQLYDRRIADAQKQAQALESVPCARNAEYSSSCPFLKMAREAKSSLAEVSAKKAAREKEVNPYTKQWKEEQKVVKSMVFSPEEAKQKQAELQKVQNVSRLLPVLKNAASSISLLLQNNGDMEERMKESKAKIEEIRQQLIKDHDAVTKADKEIAELKKKMSSYDEVFREQKKAKETLELLKQKEAAMHSEIGSCDALLKQVVEAEGKKKAIEQEMRGVAREIADTQLLIEACGKKAGVPALIVENAVPELEAEANLILENMMDGRLQIRLDTQIETGKGTKLETFRITVLDDGYERGYETYSGAEKFVVDLAIRIAMSKFLCKRSGASVSLFVLDEGVSCADENNREEIIKAIRSITHEFDTVLFVTHIEELKDALDQRIEVTKNSMGSHIHIRA